MSWAIDTDKEPQSGWLTTHQFIEAVCLRMCYKCTTSCQSTGCDFNFISGAGFHEEKKQLDGHTNRYDNDFGYQRFCKRKINVKFEPDITMHKSFQYFLWIELWISKYLFMDFLAHTLWNFGRLTWWKWTTIKGILTQQLLFFHIEPGECMEITKLDKRYVN